MMRTRLKLKKALAAAALLLALLTALLPLAALAAEEDLGEGENRVYENAPETGNFGDAPEPGASESDGETEAPPEPAPEPEGPEGGGEAEPTPEPSPEPEGPEGGGEAEPAPEPAPEPEGPEGGGEAEPAPEPAPEPEDPAGGGEAGDPPGDPPAEIREDGELPPAEPETPEIPLAANTRGRITLDGSLDDWANVPGMAHGNDRIESWKAARDLEGNVYLCFTGTAATPYDELYFYRSVVINQGERSLYSTLGELSGMFPGAEVKAVNLANGQSAAPYYLEAMIPAAYVSGEGCTLALGGESQPVLVAELPVLDGEDLPREEPVYSGILIDGGFSDWDAVAKFPIRDTSPRNNLDCAAFVFDGDVYIYIKETPGGDAAAAGSHSTGNYVITTDLGRVLKFQLKKEDGGSVFGVGGAEARHVGMQWEVRIPAAKLPYYRESLSFGLYLEEAAVSNVADRKGGGGNVGSFAGIAIDGAYGDWAAYPHYEIIEYATPGTQAPQTDSQGALYFEDGVLYGHVMTTMPRHLDSLGGDFLSAIEIAFNEEREYKEYFEDGNFYPLLMKDGRIVNEYTRLAPGVDTFLIYDRRALGDPNGRPFGTMKVTIDTDRLCDEMEFELDLKAVAESQGRSVSDLRIIEARFGRFGDKWITIAGASSGALLGVALCCGVTAGALLRRKKRGAAQ